MPGNPAAFTSPNQSIQYCVELPDKRRGNDVVGMLNGIQAPWQEDHLGHCHSPCEGEGDGAPEFNRGSKSLDHPVVVLQSFLLSVCDHHA